MDKNCILCIDDDNISSEMLKNIFKTQYEFEEAENGQSGLKKIDELGDRLCAILLNESMTTMDGTQLLHVLHERGIVKNVPVFLITLSIEHDIINEGYRLGIMDVITKPIEPLIILNRVQNIVDLFYTREAVKEYKYIQNIKKEENIVINRDVTDVLLLMSAVQSVYDMIICVNLTQNSYYMIDYDRFLTHVAGYDGVFDELIVFGASAVPESHRQIFIDTFNRESLLQAFHNGKKSVFLEHPQFSDDGVEHMVSTRVLFIEDPKTKDVLEITLSRYIDDEWEEREKTRQILSDALIVAEQANHAKTDFLSSMSHDIRTPLNAIMGMAAIIEANVDNQERIKDCVAKIGVSSKYLLELINEILDFSKIESGNLSINESDFSIKEIAEEVRVIIEQRAVEKNQKFEINIDENINHIYKGDGFRVRQIIINLLDNAYKYTPEYGNYFLNINLGKSTNTHHFILFIIEDNGIGIGEDSITKIFSPFVQCRDVNGQNGVGLGLAITRNLVHLMNGHLEVESKVGIGTKFTIEIPFEVSNVVENGMEKVKTEGIEPDNLQTAYNGEKILVAEDNELNQEIVKTILEMENLEVEIAVNGQEAVDKFISSKPGEYKLIFMDVSMPVMNGYEATKTIRNSSHAEAETIPIYALTANAFYSDAVEAENSGMNGHISKPIDFNEVSRILNQIISSRKTEKE